MSRHLDIVSMTGKEYDDMAEELTALRARVAELEAASTECADLLESLGSISRNNFENLASELIDKVRSIAMPEVR